MTVSPMSAERVFNAAYSGNVADLEAALEEDPRAVNVIGAGIEGWTALKAALVNGHPDVVPVLLRRGADPNLRDSKWGATPLYELLTNCHRPHMRLRALELAKLLLDAGANPTAAPMKGDEGKRTHVQVAQKAGLSDVVTLLAEAAARASQVKEGAEQPPAVRPEEANAAPKEEAEAAPKRKTSRQAKPAEAEADEGAQKRRRNPPRDRSKK